MQAFLFRLSALAIRLLCPLAVLAVSDAKTMGSYYLFISYFTFVVGISALELAVPFSRKFLRCKSDRQRRLLFTGFLTNQVVVTTSLAIPAGLLVSVWAGVPIALIPLFCLCLATEACVNEVGRFFCNIGQWLMPSLRDLVRAMVFTIAIVASVYLEKEVLTPVTFLTISAGNLAIMVWEWRSWGQAKSEKKLDVLHHLNSTWSRVRRSLAGSLPQFVHMQLLGLQPLLERTLIEKSMGLAAVASFAFLTSVMQSVAGLLLAPMVASVRRDILGARTPSDYLPARSQIFLLLLWISGITALVAIGVYFALPLIKLILEKEISISPLFAFVTCLVSVSAIYSSAISPLLTVGNLAWWTNTLCVIAISPLVVFQWMPYGGEVASLGVQLLAVVAVVQIAGRIIFVLKVH